MNRARRSAGIRGRGPCRWVATCASAFALVRASGSFLPSAPRTRARIESRAARLLAGSALTDRQSHNATTDEVGDARHAFFDRVLRRRVGKANVLTVTGNAPAEVDAGEKRHASFVQQSLAEGFRVCRSGHSTCLRHVGPRVEGAPGHRALDAGYFVQQTYDQVAALAK